MKTLTENQLNQIAGGVCVETYEAIIPLNYLPLVAQHLKLLNQHRFNANEMLQALNDAGLDTSQVTVKVGIECYPRPF